MNYRFKTPVLHRIAYYVFMCISIGVTIELVRRNLTMYIPRDFSLAHEADALTDWKAARLFWLDVNPYTSTGLALLGMPQVGWPPTTAFWFLPLTDLPKAAVAEIAALLVFILLVPHIYLTAKTLKWPAPAAVTALVSSLVFSTTWARYHFDATQFSEPIAFLYVITWLCLRKGKDGWAGVSIGVAMTLKLFPGLIGIFFLFGRRWRAVAAAGLTYTSIAAVMTLRFGISAWHLFFEQEKPITDGWLGSLQNASLSGIVTRSLFPFCEGDGLPSKTGTIIITIASVILVAAAIWVSRKGLKVALEVDRTAIDLPFALFVLLSVFLNPFAWEHYYMLCLHPLMIIITKIWHTCRVVLRRWSDGVDSTALLAFTGSIALASAAMIGFAIRAMSREIWVANFEIWRKLLLPEYHWWGHYGQVLNHAPWVVAISLGFMILSYRNWLKIN